MWPWLAQIATGRAGWYSYAWPENLPLASAQDAGFTNAERIVPELQRLDVGDSIPLWPMTGFTVAEVDPWHALALRATIALTEMPLDPNAPKERASFEGSWVFMLDALDRQKGRTMRANPKVHLLVVGPHHASRCLEVQGRVVESRREGAEAHADMLARRVC